MSCGLTTEVYSASREPFNCICGSLSGIVGVMKMLQNDIDKGGVIARRTSRQFLATPLSTVLYCMPRAVSCITGQ